MRNSETHDGERNKTETIDMTDDSIVYHAYLEVSSEMGRALDSLLLKRGPF